MSFTALQLNTNALYQPVNKVAHGFSIGDVLRFNGVDFVKADGSSVANAAVVGIVSSIPDANSYYITQAGFVSGLTTTPTEGGLFIAGTSYYLSQTPGQLTAIRPVTVGQVDLLCYIAYTATSGFFFTGDGQLIEPATVFAWSTIVGNTVTLSNNGYIINNAGPLTLTLPAIPAVGDIVKVSTLVASQLTVNYAAGYTITLVDVTSTITTGNVALDFTNGIRMGQATFLYQGSGNWRMAADGNWIVT
jgi:hypothetical protein